MNKNYYFSFRVNESEKEKIDKKIKKSKLKKSDYLREMALGKKLIVVDDFQKLALELNRIGVNINQISRAVNQGTITDTGEIKKYQDKYNEVMNEILEISEKIRGL